ncbi:SAM-dependent methyltransferase [Streptomyces asiaticus]|uniref:SAM-dependent methyltransferase n=1 Tax=Streptomyces asiaticus TaxID=114695 RepID=UPI0037FBA92D
MSSCQARSGGASIRRKPSAAAPPRRYGHGSVRGCRRAGSNSGSALALSHCTPDFDPQTWRKVTDIYHRAGTPVRFRDKAAVADFFTGPDLIEPGIVVGRGGRRSRQGRRRSRRGGRPSTERRGRQSVGRRRHQVIIHLPRRFHGPGLVGPASAKLRACHFLPSELL